MKINFKSKVALLLLVLSVVGKAVFAQITILPDSVNCGATSTTLHATLVGTTPISSGITTDDRWSGVIPLGFNFNFYGTSYTKCVLGGNGALCFDTSLASASFAWSITSVLLGNTAVRNSVCGPYCDIDVTGGGTITYSTVGTSPNRLFVVDFCHDAMFSCTSQWTTSQIILYETSNLVEVHITHKDTCVGWNNAAAIVGVQNAAGSAATAAPGRDYPTHWFGNHEAWRFTPNSSYTAYTASSITYAPIPGAASAVYWFDSSTGAYLGTGSTFTATPAGGSATYKAVAVGCDDSITTFVHVNLHDLTVGGGTAGVNADFVLMAHPGCNGDTVFLYNNSTPSGNTSIWNYGDGTPLDSSATNPLHVYYVQGTYSIFLTYHDASGCVDTITKMVTFNHAVTSVFTASAPSVCLGTPVTFTNTSIGGGATYNWNFGDGTSSTAMNPSHSYLNAGNYTVQLTVTDNIPCTATSSTGIQVVSIDAVAYPHDTIVCLKLPMQIGVNTKVDPSSLTAINYAWSPASNLNNPAIQTPDFFGVGDFTYTVTATVLPLGCTATDVVNIHSKPPLVFTNVTANQVITLGKSVQLNADGAYTYYWTPNNGTLDNPNINNPMATPVDSVTEYRVIGSTLYGCKDTAYITVRVDQFSPDNIPTAFTPNGDGINDVFRVFNLKYQKLVEMRVYDRWGREVFYTNDQKKGWDGYYNGAPQDLGVYNYQVIIAYPDGTQRAVSGNVTLVR